MKRLGLLFSLLGLLAACSVEDAEDNFYYLDDNNAVHQALYDGEWTVNKQVVDTARLEVNEVLKVRLPENYLANLCFSVVSEKNMFSDGTGVLTAVGESVSTLKGQPAVIYFRDQGYSSTASFADIGLTESNYNGEVVFNNASFTIAIGGVDYRVGLLSNDPGTAVYRNDTGLWTIAIPISAFLVTNLNTREESELQLPSAVTIYYNAKKRIR